MPLGGWPSITDDSGTKTDGTLINKALFDSIKASIEADVFSGTTSAKNIIDEVIAARGTLGSLDERLDVSLNEDGTPKAVAGQATTEQVGRQVNGYNLARNPNMREWSKGSAAAPDYYTLSGAGTPSVAQAGAGLGDGTQVGTGRFTAKITSDAVNATQLQQIVIASTEMDDYTVLRGRKVNFAVRATATSANMFKLIISDGVGTSEVSNTETGLQDLSLQRTLDSGATQLQVAVEVTLGGNVVYIGAFSVTFGDVKPTRWVPTEALEPNRARGPIVLHKQVTNFNSNTTLGSSRYVFSLLANTLAEDFQSIEVTFAGTLANNANAKSIKLYINTHFLTILVDNVALASNTFTVRGTLTRLSATGAAFDGVVTFHAAGGAPPTVWHWASPLAGGSINFATAQDFVIELITPTANADIVLARTKLVLHP